MERLTFVPNDGRNAGLRGFCTEQDAINRLAAYENTGLEPEEVVHRLQNAKFLTREEAEAALKGAEDGKRPNRT